MLFALGAMSSAMDALQSLTGSKSSSAQTTGFNVGATNPFDIDAGASAGNSASTSASTAGTTGIGISPQTMSALLAAQSQSADGSQASSTPTSRSAALQDLFSQIDANGDGQISKTEFENALGAGGTNLAQADSVFGKLDTNGDGSVSLKEMGNALTGRGHHHLHAGGAGGTSGANGSGSNGSNSDPLLQALDGASSTAVTNSDGSTTTTITYADGSKVSMTTAAASSTSNSSSASSAAASSYNWIEQMIQREASMLAASAASSSVSLTA